MARLEAAVRRAPLSERPVAQGNSAAADDEGDKPRFGINSLINRMTGSGAEAASQQPARQQPQVAAAVEKQPEAAADPDQERIEIPAFLRRQAN